MVDIGLPGCNFSSQGRADCGYNVDTSSGEMAHLYYVTLGNLAFCHPSLENCPNGPQAGWGLTNTGGFQNLQPVHYWSSVEKGPDSMSGDPSNMSAFQFNLGSQRYASKNDGWMYSAIAVRPGNVAAVPEPQTYVMLLLGMGAVLLAARRRPQ